MAQRIAPRLIVAALCMAATAIADGQGHTASVRGAPIFANEVEGSLVRAIVSLREGGLKHAMGEIDRALDLNANYRLAHLVRGDMLMARAGKPVAFASLSATPASVAPLQEEARVRMHRYLDAPRLDEMPAAVLQLAPNQQHVLVVDTSRSRLFVYANDVGRPRYVTDFYISLGKNGVEKSREGDQKTPIGVYRIVASKEKLPDFYGPTAFPLDYPNEWDRMNDRKGHGIWLHGTPSDTYARAPFATDGCIVLTNDDLAKLMRYVDVSRTPVVIGNGVKWEQGTQWESGRESFLKDFESWRKDWESRDLDKYFTHYATDFRTERRDLAGWKASKRKSNTGKAWIKVGVQNMSVFAYPGGRDMMMVTFDQDYRSNNLSNRVVKRQYWVREDRGWRILHEAIL